MLSGDHGPRIQLLPWLFRQEAASNCSWWPHSYGILKITAMRESTQVLELVFKCCRGSSCDIWRCVFNFIPYARRLDFIGCLETSSGQSSHLAHARNDPTDLYAILPLPAIEDFPQEVAFNLPASALCVLTDICSKICDDSNPSKPLSNAQEKLFQSSALKDQLLLVTRGQAARNVLDSREEETASFRRIRRKAH
ncbi:hypothetical protein HPB51_023101 [Rhipicephalus microplus]|uniref:Uncharacterized protein n=1 Tax=Rhipicephalus microplus TaxID=6941 RepID=A0A9J6DJC9_RHIMP|nr:hypothetical protein HPB51_023101 [Rhipicephalus microplus]